MAIRITHTTSLSEAWKKKLNLVQNWIIERQEPITWRVQLPRTLVTAFSRTSLFLERFWRDFRISFKPHKPVSKTYIPENDNLFVLMTLRFPLRYLIFRLRSKSWRRFHFRGKNCPKMCLKIMNQSVKRRDISVLWTLLAPDYRLLRTFIGCPSLNQQLKN